MLNIGQLIDERFEVKKIFEKSVSNVYLCLDKKTGKLIVLKEGTRKEGKILEKLDSPFIVKKLFDIDWEGKYFLAEEYVPGQTIKSLPLKEKMMDAKLALYIIRQICSALIYIHNLKPPIIYRDIKPSNIIINSKGKIKIIDFGAAKEYVLRANEDEQSIGTKGYAAPEQYEGEGQSDNRSDIYGLGALFYYLLTGQDLSIEPHVMLPLTKIRNDIPKGIEKIIKKCTKHLPKDRYESAEALLYDLEHYDEIEEEKEMRKTKKIKIKANPVALALLLLALVIYVAGFIFGIGISVTKNGEVNFTLAALYWFVAFAFGTIIMGLSQIIKLLNDIKNHFYE